MLHILVLINLKRELINHNRHEHNAGVDFKTGDSKNTQDGEAQSRM